jgi:hypothetical protein
MQRLRRAWLQLAVLLVSTSVLRCGGSNTSSGSTGEGQILNGNERFGWDQPASDRSELASFRFALYVDGVRAEAVDVTCGNTASSGGYPCTCRLPQMTPGSHTLQVAAYVTDGGAIKESSRSAAVRVTVR